MKTSLVDDIPSEAAPVEAAEAEVSYIALALVIDNLEAWMWVAVAVVLLLVKINRVDSGCMCSQSKAWISWMHGSLWDGACTQMQRRPSK